ncbi:hypothetical protein J7E35_09550 [Bacillus sp. ISL-45]|nr:hypothetical protein [Bacillus sp. ISL-39]MBT2638331.1 hypothetical protein [Bacillus sp. ISL-39]MBT2661313.1 hypothetical protein [Bacillus sp. ISL-45]
MDELLKKLRYKQGTARVMNAPKEYESLIEDIGDESDKNEFMLLFSNNSQEVREWFPKAVSGLKEDAVFWIAFPKKSSKVKTDINRDALFRLVQDISDYRAVSNVSMDEKWSALRFRHQDLVKSKK